MRKKILLRNVFGMFLFLDLFCFFFSVHRFSLEIFSAGAKKIPSGFFKLFRSEFEKEFP